jgi:hypothetical protein
MKISELNSATSIDGTEVFPIVQGGETKKFSTGALVQRPYKVYAVSMSQIYPSDPVVTHEFENSIGNIVWTRNSDGDYTGDLIGGFVGYMPKLQILSSLPSGIFFVYIEKISDDQLLMQTYQTDLQMYDNGLTDTFIEIRVY